MSRMVETNMGTMPEEDYRDIIAYQSGFDSYREFYEAGYRIGGDLDINPDVEDAAIDYDIHGADDFEEI